MLQSIRVHIDQINQKLAVFVLVDEEDVIADQFRDQIAPLLRRYLQSVNPERQHHLDDILRVAITLGPNNSILVLK
jgi:hypothetical protein